MPAYSGYFARHTDGSLLQAGEIGLQRKRNLDSLLQAGKFGLQRTEGTKCQLVSCIHLFSIGRSIAIEFGNKQSTA
ncbi:hypothetical protein DQG23_11820 [Paenibacillus contaminans]|uniref:Uncharacterized protein n=1 Tax=Paenibacillus contaminans TaxID=450362 RepID=A0A329MN88_9BACL|nr:hypothetical protein DQG23_11820 [Paenibacillus contaminans]